MSKNKVKHLKMMDLPDQERPYERLLNLGAEHLSDGELLSIILQTGYQGKTSLDLAHELLKSAEPGGLLRLSHYTSVQLMEFHGIGEVKAARILATFELGRRLRDTPKNQRPVFNSSESVFKYLHGAMGFLEHEEVRVLLLNSHHRLIRELKHGDSKSVNTAAIYVRDIVRQALTYNAVSVILVHNHPTGDAKPSSSDLVTTQKLRDGLKSVGIRMLDHIIIGRDEYYSFKGQTVLLDDL